MTMASRERHLIELAKMRMVADNGESVAAFEQRDKPMPKPHNERFVGIDGINKAVKKNLGEDYEVL